MLTPTAPLLPLPSTTHAAGLDEKERGYGEELVALAVEALMRAAALEGGQALPERQERRMARMLQASSGSVGVSKGGAG